MGTTTTSLHVLIPPFGEELAADTIAKSVEKRAPSSSPTAFRSIVR